MVVVVVVLRSVCCGCAGGSGNLCVVSVCQLLYWAGMLFVCVVSVPCVMTVGWLVVVSCSVCVVERDGSGVLAVWCVPCALPVCVWCGGGPC